MIVRLQRPSRKILFIIIGTIILLVGLVLLIIEVQRQQELRQRAEEPEIPACPVSQAVCSWDAVNNTTQYRVEVFELPELGSSGSAVLIKSEIVQHPTTQLIFPAVQGKGYRCSVIAENPCGVGTAGESETEFCPVEITPTPTPSETPTETPSPSVSETPTPTVSLSPTVTPTGTLTPTLTPSTTPTITPSATLSPTVTPSRTPTPSATSTPTPQPTSTPGPTSTPQPTFTPAPTFTPVPTFTPAPTVPPTIAQQTTPVPTLPPTGDATGIILTIVAAALTILGGVFFFII